MNLQLDQIKNPIKKTALEDQSSKAVISVYSPYLKPESKPCIEINPRHGVSVINLVSSIQ